MPSPPTKKPRRPLPPFLVRLGQRALGKAENAGGVATLLGEVILATLKLFQGKARFDRRDFWEVVAACGVQALPVVALVNLLVGAILAFVGAVQLKKFGADVFVADLVSIASVREMAVVITAVVLCGRTGAAFAARIATMQGNEEVDALRVLGVNPVEYLVIPRMLALTLMTPLLYLYACAVALLGGYLVAAGMLDVSSTLYWDRTVQSLAGRHFTLGLLKAVAFGGLVAYCGCYQGLMAGRNAAAVGEATTKAVVTGIVGVIVVDAIFAVCAWVLDL